MLIKFYSITVQVEMTKYLAAFLLTLASSVFAAQPVNLVVPVLPGGNIDAFARAVSQALTDNSIPNVVTYHPGAAGDIAYGFTQAYPDNTILVGGASHFVASHVQRNRSNFHLETMRIVGPLAEAPPAFLTDRSGTIPDIRSLIDLARTEDVPCGVSSASGSELERINREYKTRFVPVQYKGTAQIKLDLLGSNIKCGYDGVGAYINENGAIKILATAKQIIAGVPPISKELRGYSYSSWFGVAIPKNGNLASSDKLKGVLLALNKDATFQKRITSAGMTVETPDPSIEQKVHDQTASGRYLANDVPRAQPLEFVVGASAGGPDDSVTRALAEKFSKVGIETVVLNKPGAAHVVGIEYLASNKKPTLIVLTDEAAKHTLLSNAKLLGTLGRFSSIVYVAADSKFRSLADLRAASEKRSIVFGHGGFGTYSHKALVATCKAMVVACLQVPYKSGADGLLGILTGSIDAYALVSYGAARVSENGRYRAIGNAPTEPGELLLLGHNLNSSDTDRIRSTVISLDKRFYGSLGLRVPSTD